MWHKKNSLIVLAILIFCSVSISVKAQSDFERGTINIFSDSLDHEQLGEFPSKWDLVHGNVEAYSFQEKTMIGFIGAAEIKPLIKQEEYLPEIFTLEFDAYFHLQGNEAYIINFGKAGTITIRSYFALYKENKGQTKSILKEPGWIHVALSFNKRALKVYMNNDRVINVPNVTERPRKVSFSVISTAALKGFPALMDNILIAEGGVKLYDRLMTDGKIVTNDIHFESGKAIIKPESINILDQITALLKEHAELKFRIEGHTDGDGSDADNQILSEQRALAVKNALIERGVDGTRLTTIGYGESKPLADNTSEEAKALNRRVEFVTVK